MKDDVLSAAPETGARFERNTEVSRLVGVLAQVYYRLDSDVNKLRASRTIETAKGKELDLKAREVGVQRPESEGDDTFRRRALAGRTRSRSQTTFDELAEGALQFLNATPSDIELRIDHSEELGAVIVVVNTEVIDNSPFSESTIVEYLEGMIPMDRRVVIRNTDGFQFSSSDTTSEKSGSGWGQGEWTE